MAASRKRTTKTTKAVDSGVALPRSLVGKVRSRDAITENPAGNAISRTGLAVRNQSIESIRSRAISDVQAVRDLTSFEGTFSSAVFNFVEVAHTGYNFAAYTSDTHQLDVQGTRVTESIVTRIDSPFDYTQGFADKPTLREVIEMALLETVQAGGFGCELVMDKNSLPDRISVVAYDSLEKVARSNGQGWYPRQTTSTGDPIDLDIPNFFISELHRFANEPYARSMLAPAINGTYAYQGFHEEMRRAVRRGGHSRTVVTLNAEKTKAAAPAEIQSDPEKLKNWYDTVKSQVEEGLQTLDPEDVLVVYDTAEVETLRADQDKSDYVPLMNAISGQLATSLKISPSVIGLRIQGSQSLANTESLLFLKTAKAVQRTVEDALSRALTLAVRLTGLDVYVRFWFDPIDLRPSLESASHRLMEQTRILQQLSLGRITDEDAAIEMKTGALPEGAPRLSGTMFMHPDILEDALKLNTASLSDTPQGRTLQPEGPASPSNGTD